MNESTQTDSQFFLQLISNSNLKITFGKEGNIRTIETSGRSSETLSLLTNRHESHLEESQELQQNPKAAFHADGTQTDGFSINNANTQETEVLIDVDQTKFNEGQDRKTKELWEKLLKAEEMLQEAEEKLLKAEDLKTHLDYSIASPLGLFRGPCFQICFLILSSLIRITLFLLVACLHLNRFLGRACDTHC